MQDTLSSDKELQKQLPPWCSRLQPRALGTRIPVPSSPWGCPQADHGLPQPGTARNTNSSFPLLPASPVSLAFGALVAEAPSQEASGLAARGRGTAHWLCHSLGEGGRGGALRAGSSPDRSPCLHLIPPDP